MRVFYIFVIDFHVLMGVQRFTWRRSREVKRSTPRKCEKQILELIPALVQALILPTVLYCATLVHCTVLVLVDLQLAFRGRRPQTGAWHRIGGVGVPSE